MELVYKGELTPEQMTQYGYGYIDCNFCKSIELVWSNAVNDAVCEECGQWQQGEEI
jgi:ribosomal protein S27E